MEIRSCISTKIFIAFILLFSVLVSNASGAPIVIVEDAPEILTIAPNEVITFEVTLKNTGDKYTDSTIVFEHLPDGITIIDNGGSKLVDLGKKATYTIKMKADSRVKSGTYTFELADNAKWDESTWREVTLQVGSMQTENAIPTAIPTAILVQKTVKKNNNIDADIIANAENYKILLDTKVKVMDTVNLNKGTYYIVEYSNFLPYASGIEVISSSGAREKDSDIVEPVFASRAWKMAAGQLTSSDIQTLKEVLQTSQSIDSTISPVLSATSYTLDKIDWLKSACVKVPFVGKKCAWDVVNSAYPGIGLLKSELENLKDDLTEWKNAASKVNQHLPKAISGLEKVKGGGQVDPKLQNEITMSMQGFGNLETKTNQMSNKLSAVSNTLSSAESAVKSASNTPVVGKFVSEFAKAIKSMNRKVVSLKGDADQFSKTLQKQSSKLLAVTTTANQQKSALKNEWNARQSASTKVYATIGGLAIVIIVILLLLMRRRKTLKTKEET